MGNHPLSTSWSKGKEFKKPFDYSLENNPEQTVTLRRIDMGDILKLGVANELDFMSKALITADPSKDDDKSREAVVDAISQSGNMEKMEIMVNKVVLAGLIDPKPFPVPEHENARQAGLLYVDEIPFEDRIELFSVIFDTEGLSTFREEQKTGVGDVADVPSVQLPPDGFVGVRPDDSEGVLLQ